MADQDKSINKSSETIKNPTSAMDAKASDKSKSLEQKAVDEILREIKLKSVRADVVGPSGWLEAPVKRTNKRFLGNTLKAAVTHNARKADNQKFQSEKRLLEMKYERHPSRRPKFGDRKILFKKPAKDVERGKK